MHKKILLLIIIILSALMIFSSCSLIKKDLEVDKQTEIINIDGKQITKQEVLDRYNQVLGFQNFYYQYQTGRQLDTSDKTLVSSLQDEAINAIIREKVAENKLKELGFDTFSEDEIKAFQEEAEKQYASNVDKVKEEYFKDTKLEGEELDKAIAEKMEENGFTNLETIIESSKRIKSNEKLREYAIKDVEVTDQDVKDNYETNIANAKSRYSSNISAYGSDILNGVKPYYVPAGYRYVKQILVKFDDEDAKEIQSLKSQIQTKEAQISSVKASIAELNAEKEEEKTQIDELNNALDNYSKEIEEAQAKLTTKTDEAYSKIQEKLDAVKARLTNGDDFDKVMEELGEDPGMKQSPAKETGYPVTKGFEPFDVEFVNAAMNLKNINDVSDPVKGSFGYYIIKYVSDAVEGNVDFDTVKDDIKQELLSNKQNQAFENSISEWVKAAKVKIYKDRLN